MRLFQENRKGMVLILTFIIITTLTVIVVAFLYLNSTQLRGAGYNTASQKAVWLAEAGIQQVIYNLRTSSNYVTNPTAINGNLGGGTYSVTVSKSGSTFTITSTGTMSGIQKQVTQTVVSAYQTAYGTLTAGKDWNGN